MQLEEVKEACCDFLQTQLGLTNVFGIIELADLYSCTNLLTSSEQFIQQHFLYEIFFYYNDYLCKEIVFMIEIF